MRKITAIMLAIILSLSLIPGTAFAEPTAAEKQAEAAAALESLNEMQAFLDKASDDYFNALAEQEAAQAKMEEAQARVDEISAEIVAVQEKLSVRANSMYRSGSATFLDLLLGSATFEEFVNNWDILNRMNQDDADTVQLAKDLRSEAEEQKDEYTRQEALASEKAEEMRQIRDEAEATTASMQAIYDNLSAEAAELLEQERIAAEAAAAAEAQSVLEAAAYIPPNNTPPRAYDEELGRTIVERANSWVGNADYVWGGCSPGEFDCSGLVAYALTGQFKRMGSTLNFLTWPRVGIPQPGDIAVNTGHCGIYIGNGYMIHAATFGVGVIVGPVQSGMVFVRY